MNDNKIIGLTSAFLIIIAVMINSYVLSIIALICFIFSFLNIIYPHRQSGVETDIKTKGGK